MSSNLEERVFIALGEASVCWENPGGAGVFDSSRARRIGDELVAWLRDTRQELVEAIRLTVEYVGIETLPPLEGWSWWEAYQKNASPEQVQYMRDWYARVMHPTSTVFNAGVAEAHGVASS